MRPRERELPAGQLPRPVFLQVNVAEDARFELARGCPNTLSNNADQRSPGFGTVRDLRLSGPPDHAGRPRTQANETTFETTSRSMSMKLGLSPGRPARLTLLISRWAMEPERRPGLLV
jgi:hypothetical protein